MSIDFIQAEAPTCRCSCPSRQFPCKHALGLMFEMLAGKGFEAADIPQDIADKRARQAARAAKREAAADAPEKPAKSKKPNAAARKKKLAKQLEGLDMAEKMVDDLLTSGLGALAGSSAQTFDKLAKDLGSCYLTGPQTAFTRIALTVRTVQKDPAQSDAAYAEALRLLVALRSTIKKGRVFLTEKLEAGNYSAEDSALFEALGGVWKLEDLNAVGSVRENTKLVQLSFDVSFDQAKKEYVERGWWLDLDAGDIWQTLNLRPLKALKYVKGGRQPVRTAGGPGFVHLPRRGGPPGALGQRVHPAPDGSGAGRSARPAPARSGGGGEAGEGEDQKHPGPQIPGGTAPHRNAGKGGGRVCAGGRHRRAPCAPGPPGGRCGPRLCGAAGDAAPGRSGGQRPVRADVL